MNVLVVDDNEKNRKLLRVLLSSHQIETVEADDGVQALSILAEQPIDVIVSDILMPNMDGFRLCFEIRRDERFRQIGIIMYTATDFTTEDEKRAFQLGADKFLRKQGSTAAILAAIYEATEEISHTRRRNAPIVLEYPELQVMKEYNQAMIHKLEERTTELEKAKEELSIANRILEERVLERTANLEMLNKELETFSYSVSHDLRAPLRWIEAYSAMLVSECGEQLNSRGKEYLQHIRKAQFRMTQLISDLLVLARVNKGELRRSKVDLSSMARDILEKLVAAEPETTSEIIIERSLEAEGDESLLHIALDNLLNNAWKYSGKANQRRIEFGRKIIEGNPTFFLRDNGVGFDMEYAHNLFGPFQRLHSDSEFPGTGIGLATVQRVIHRHGGKIWAESAPGEGATFYFTVE